MITNQELDSEEIPLELLQSLELLPPSKIPFANGTERNKYLATKKEYINHILMGVTYRNFYHPEAPEIRGIDRNAKIISQEFLDMIWEKCGGSKNGRKPAMARSLVRIKNKKRN